MKDAIECRNECVSARHKKQDGSRDEDSD